MCRRQVSVGWDGTLYDCDFNLALGLPLDHGAPDHIRYFTPAALKRRRIVTGNHCSAVQPVQAPPEEARSSPSGRKNMEIAELEYELLGLGGKVMKTYMRFAILVAAPHRIPVNRSRSVHCRSRRRGCLFLLQQCPHTR